jgi:alanine dehydrogenase
LITRAREPVLTSAMVPRGAHVNAAGAITRERREFSQDLFARATLVAVDTLPGTRQLSAEFTDWYDGQCGGDWTRVQPISAIVAAGKPRPGNTDVSLFKPMGMGISDVSLGIEIVRRAEASGIGRTMPDPGFAVPRISTASRQESAA